MMFLRPSTGECRVMRLCDRLVAIAEQADAKLLSVVPCSLRPLRRLVYRKLDVALKQSVGDGAQSLPV